MTEDLLAGFTLGKAGDQRPFLTPGRYTIQIQGVRMGRSNDGLRYVAVDGLILKSDKSEENEPCAVGLEVVWLQFLDGKTAKVAPRNLANFLAAATGCAGEELSTETLRQVVGGDDGGGGPLGDLGVEVMAQAFTATAKTSGHQITKVGWSPIQGKRLIDLVGGVT